MEMLTAFFTALGQGITSFGQMFVTGVYDLFVGLFAETATEGGAITGLNELGYIVAGLLAIPIVIGIFHLVINLFGSLRRGKRV